MLKLPIGWALACRGDHTSPRLATAISTTSKRAILFIASLLILLLKTFYTGRLLFVQRSQGVPGFLRVDRVEIRIDAQGFLQVLAGVIFIAHLVVDHAIVEIEQGVAGH